MLKKAKGQGRLKTNSKEGGTGNTQKPKGQNQDFKLKGIQCYECGGYGHIAVDCGNNKDKKSYTLTWSDSEDSDNGEQAEQQTGNFVAFQGNMYHPDDVEERENFEKFFKIIEEVVEDSEIMMDSNHMQPTTTGAHEVAEEIQTDDDDVDLTHEENEEIQTDDEDLDIVEAYEDLYNNWCKVSKLNLMLIKNVESLELENSALKTSVEELKIDLDTKVSNELYLQEELESFKKRVRMLNTGTNSLNEILQSRGNNHNKVALGFTSGQGNQKNSWVPEKISRRNTEGKRYVNYFFNKTCFRCNMKGHGWRCCRQNKPRQVWQPKQTCLTTK